MSGRRLPAALTTGQFRLSGAEYASTAVVAAVSSGAYIGAGFPYLARGVVGDLLGFATLAVVARATGRRLRHEAALCLALIGLVLAVDPRWPLRVPAAAWWALFAAGLAAYLVVRRRVCG